MGYLLPVMACAGADCGAGHHKARIDLTVHTLVMAGAGS